MSAVRYFWAGVVCAVIAAGLTWRFSDGIFSAQNASAINQVISIEVLEPGLELKVTP